MKNIRLKKSYSIISIILLSFLTSCLAAGVPYTSDPYKKLSYALQMDTFGRCIPAINFAQDSLQTFQKKDDKFGIQFSYLVLSINSEEYCYATEKYDHKSEEEMRNLPKEYFVKAIEIDAPKQIMELTIEGLSQYLQKHRDGMYVTEVYHKYKIIQFYHLILATKYKSEDSKIKVDRVQKIIESIKKDYPDVTNRKYMFDYTIENFNRYAKQIVKSQITKK